MSSPSSHTLPSPPVARPWRALLVGSGIGAVLAAGNVYAGLKTGYIDGGSITAALLGSLLLSAWARRPAHALDINLTQTVASSAAVMSFAAGVGAPMPALALLGHPLPAAAILVWGLALAVLGIAVACLLRGRLIVSEDLPFPSGRATAEVIAAISTKQGDHRLRSLGAAAALAALFTYLRDGGPALIPGSWSPSFTVFGYAAVALTLGISSSPLLVATGVLVGQRAAISMAIGALLAWAVLAPSALGAGLAAEATYPALVPVLLWPGLALMVGSGFAHLALSWRTFGRSFADLSALLRNRSTPAAATPTSGARPLILMSLLALVPVFGVGRMGFDLGWVVLLALVPLAVVLAAVAARAAGETDQAPVGQVGALAQLGCGARGVVPSVGAGALVAGVATQTAQTLWALKAGQRLGAPVRGQVIAQLLGAVVGAVVVVPIYTLIHAAYQLGSEKMPAPAALAWKATAEIAHGSWSLSHPLILGSSLAALALGVVLTWLERRHARWLPSPTAMGAAFVLPASMSITILLGALVMGRLARRAPGFADDHGPPLAAGGIAGESLMGLVLAALVVIGSR
ncbi:MAG TPA: OPT/YSL family transporter [Polyangia bacterium]